MSSKKSAFVPVFAHKYHRSSKINQSNECFKGRQVTCWKDCALTLQVEETRAVSACPTQELTKFMFWSSCLGDDLNVTRVRSPSSWFMKTLCLESTLHIMLSRPIGPCIRKNRWTAGILSMLQLVRNNVEQPWLSVGSWCSDLMLENSDFWRMHKESWWRVTVPAPVQALRSFLLDYRRSFRKNTCVVTWFTCLALLQKHTAKASAVSGSEFSNIQPACHLVTSSCPDLGPLQYHSFRMFQVVQKVLTNASNCKVGFTSVHNLTSKIHKLTTYHEVSVVCKLKALHNTPSSRIRSSNYWKA